MYRKLGFSLFQRLSNSLRLPFRPQALVMDFDGVLTDNRVIVTEDGQEAVLCHRGDGLGLSLLRDKGFPLLILSREPNPVVAQRAKKLKVECLSGCRDKLSALKAWADGKSLILEKIVYIGNDVNDLECIQAVGLGVAVADAEAAVLDAAQLILTKKGGSGAVREISDMIRLKLGEAHE